MHEIKHQRHGGTYKDKASELINTNSDIYDWVVDIDLITKITKEGWDVHFGKNFLNSSTKKLQKQVIGCSGSDGKISKKAGEGQKTPPALAGVDPGKHGDENMVGVETLTESWEGAIVAVVGLYDKGKTFVLNN